MERLRCDGVVVSVVGGYGETLDSVEMYECGTYGVYGCAGNVEIINCDIHDCSIGAYETRWSQLGEK